ncbi:hypothetical protein OAP83_00335 [Rickettsiales bacterium]|nr:hypothetical protein [Rickettsiales bacterium]
MRNAKNLSSLLSLTQRFFGSSQNSTLSGHRSYSSGQPPSVLGVVFSSLKLQIENCVKKQVENIKNDPNFKSNKLSDISFGHKVIASRTMYHKVFGELKYLTENPIHELEKTLSKQEIKDLIKHNPVEFDFTAHPTEGQNEYFVGKKQSIIKSMSLMGKVMYFHKVSPKDVIDLNRVRMINGLEPFDLSTLPSFRRFLNTASETCETLVSDFMARPIHHENKMTRQEETDMLLNRMLHVKLAAAILSTDFPEYFDASHVKIGSWVGDLDGKDNINAGHVVIFTYKAQQKFFESLIEQLEDFDSLLKLCKIDNSDFKENVVDKIIFLASQNNDKILIGEDAIRMEQRLDHILSVFPLEDNEIILSEYSKIRNFIKSSGCKISYNGFSSREEVDKTVAAVDEIEQKCFSGVPLSLTSGADKLAQNFDKLSVMAKRQIMCMMEGAILNNRHQHIISQFNGNLESYRKILFFYELVKKLPEFHENIDFFKTYYAGISEKEGFDLYQQLFSVNSIQSASLSMVEISPLAEEYDTISSISDYTESIISDPDILSYIKQAGGILRQTRSNSDGTAALGSHYAVYSHLVADKTVKSKALNNSLTPRILAGAGNNDSDRNGSHSIVVTPNHVTVQGSDGQNIDLARIIDLSFKSQDPSEQLLAQLRVKYKEQQLEELLDFYYTQHKQSEFGLMMDIDGKDLYLGKIIHRGITQEKTLNELDRLSSRPSNRGGENSFEKLLSDIDLDAPTQTMFKKDMRRIGETNTQRLSVSTFSLAPYYQSASKIKPELHADIYNIPQFRNIAFTAIFKLGIADYKSLFLLNRLNIRPDFNEAKLKADLYEEFLNIAEQDCDEAAFEFAESRGFNHLNGFKEYICCYHAVKAKNVCRNIIEPLVYHSDQSVKDSIEVILNEVESSQLLFENYGMAVTKILQVLVDDKTQTIDDRKTFAAIAQKIHNFRKPEHSYDTRRVLIQTGTDAIEWQDDKSLGLVSDYLSRIIRSSGNPGSGTGGKVGGYCSCQHDYQKNNSSELVLDVTKLDEDVKESQHIHSVVDVDLNINSEHNSTILIR